MRRGRGRRGREGKVLPPRPLSSEGLSSASKVSTKNSDTRSSFGQPAKQEIIFKDYKDVDGVKRPTKFVMLYDGKKFLEATVVEQHMLEKIDDKEFSE